MLDLPRSVRLAAWGTAVLTGSADVAAAVRAVTGDDEPHAVEMLWQDPTVPDRLDLARLLQHFAQVEIPGLAVVLPAPGDALGLPGPPEFNRLAVAAGECVLTQPVTAGWAAGFAPSGGIVPAVTAFGSAWEPGAMVTWSVHPVNPARITVVGSLAEAERELREALVTATETLARLDVARWREDAAARVAEVRDGALPRSALPPSAPPRAGRVLATAARVRAIVDLAGEDDGAALSSYEIEQRARTLRSLDGVCRRAMAAAVGALREPR